MLDNEKDIEDRSFREGLITAALQLEWQERNELSLISAIARGASRRAGLFLKADGEILNKLSGPEFFRVQTVLCEVIPALESLPIDIMTLVKELVKVGGQDLAANQPYQALIKWCSIDQSRSEEIINIARAGNELALEHLVFALQAKGDVNEAYYSASQVGLERDAGILVLSRLPLDIDEAKKSIDLIIAALNVSDIQEAAGFLKSCFDIASRHENISRNDISDALEIFSKKNHAQVIHFMASALKLYSKTMSEKEIDICISGIQAIDTCNTGTIEEIEWGLFQLWAIYPEKSEEALGQIISITRGSVGKILIEHIFSQEPNDIRAKIATRWLMSGNIYLCKSIADQVTEINRSSPCIEVSNEILPKSPLDQVFLCKKVVGYLFMSPMTVASWLVAIIRAEGEASKVASELLFDPMLLNYRGSLKRWLEEKVELAVPNNLLIREALTKAENVWSGIKETKDIVELEPSTAERVLVQFQDSERSEEIRSASNKNSVFFDLITTQTLLYGDRTGYSIMHPDGERQSQDMKLHEMSVSVEIPQGWLFDPVGLELTLDQYKYEQWADK